MHVSKRYRPISDLENTADITRELAAESGPIVITEDGVPSFVCISFDDYCEMQETNALIKLVDFGEREFDEGQFVSLDHARAELDEKILGKGSTSEAN